MRYTTLSILPFLIFFTFCGNEKNPGIPAHLKDVDPLIVLDPGQTNVGISLSKDQLYQDSLLIDRITDVTTHPNGNLYVAGEAWQRVQIYQFDRNGNRVGTFGKYGSGEGQFKRINGIQLLDGFLYVFDGEQERITVLHAQTGRLERVIPLRPEASELPDDLKNKTIIPVYAVKSDLFLVKLKENTNPAYYPERYLTYMYMNDEGELNPDVILRQKDINYLIGDYAGRPAPFTLDRPEKSIFEISAGGFMANAWTGEFLIELYDLKGHFIRAYYQEYPRADLDKEYVVNREFSHNDQLLRVRQTADYPDRWPALYSMVLDDRQRMWVSSITSVEEEMVWWIIDETGEYSTITWPADQPIVHVRDGYAYTVESDSTGFKDVVRYEIIMNEK